MSNPKNAEKRVQLSCPYCHSTNVVRDSVATWCEDSQDWVLSGLYDEMSCNDCGEDRIKELAETSI